MSLLTAVYLAFLLLLFVPSMFEGALSTVLYIFAFLLPLAFGIYASREKGGKLITGEYLTVSREGLLLSLPTVFPTVLLVFTLSYLTSLLIYVTTGASNSVELGNNIFIAVIEHALIPAVLEELLFRYLPLRLLGKRSPRAAVIASAVFFAFVHHSFFSIPYAFVAGVVFMVIDIMADSVIPSVAVHFINNLLSVVWVFFSGTAGFSPLFFGILAGLSLVSAVALLIYRKHYAEGIRRALRTGEKYTLSYEPLLFIIPSLFIAVTELI